MFVCSRARCLFPLRVFLVMWWSFSLVFCFFFWTLFILCSFHPFYSYRFHNFVGVFCSSCFLSPMRSCDKQNNNKMWNRKLNKTKQRRKLNENLFQIWPDFRLATLFPPFFSIKLPFSVFMKELWQITDVEKVSNECFRRFNGIALFPFHSILESIFFWVTLKILWQN